MIFIAILLFILLYILPVIKTFDSIRIRHSKGGKLESLNVTFADVIIMFLPMVNIIASLDSLITGDKKIDKTNLNDIFNVKK